MNEHSFALLLDENISYRIVKRILHLFPESQAAKRLRLEAKEDGLIWEVAKQTVLQLSRTMMTMSC